MLSLRFVLIVMLSVSVLAHNKKKGKTAIGRRQNQNHDGTTSHSRRVGHCPEKPVIEHAAVLSECSDSVIFQCMIGYRQQVVSECKKNGNWEYTNVECVKEKGIDCGDPSPVDNAVLGEVSSTDVNSVVMFTCNPDYQLNGTVGEMICAANGSWVANITCDFCYSDRPGELVNDDSRYVSDGDGNQTKCSELCDADDTCGLDMLYTGFGCFLISKPTSMIDYTYPSENEGCRDDCTNNIECRSFNSLYDDCFLFNDVVETITTSFTAVYAVNDCR